MKVKFVLSLILLLAVGLSATQAHKASAKSKSLKLVPTEECDVSDFEAAYSEGTFVITGGYNGDIYIYTTNPDGSYSEFIGKYSKTASTLVIDVSTLPPGDYNVAKCDPRHGGVEPKTPRQPPPPSRILTRPWWQS